MCGKAGLLVGWDHITQRALITRADCDSWDCPECAVRMKNRWSMRADIGVRQYLCDGRTVDFVTITSHEKLKSFAATEAVWRKAWQPLYHALKRRNVDIQYMIVPEKHKDGRMHVHALWTAGVTQKWLKDNARKRGLGHQAKVIHILEAERANRYIVKYIGKDLGDEVPKHFRRVRVSRNWAEIPPPVNELSGLSWQYVGTNGALETIYETARQRGFALIDLQTGEYFDDVDLGTITA